MRGCIVGGQTQSVPILGLGNNSAQTVVVPDPRPATEIAFMFAGSGAIDDIELLPACGDGLIDQGETCDPPASQGGDPRCSDACELAPPRCGDGFIDPPAEQCDPPAIAGGDAECHPDCTLGDPCGNGFLDPGGACESPQGSEICDNGQDDDDDGQIHCADDECLPLGGDPEDFPTFCNGLCTDEGACLPIKRDPALIRFGSLPKLDFFSIHGRVDVAPGSFDPIQRNLRIVMVNSRGVFLDVTLEAGKLTSRNRRLFCFKNALAKTQGAQAEGGWRLSRVNAIPPRARRRLVYRQVADLRRARSVVRPGRRYR